MKVTHKTIQSGQTVDRNTIYIIYFPGNAENVGKHSNENWSWCDENTVVDLCNYPYHSEWHNFDMIGFSKVNLRSYKIGVFLSAVLFNIPIIALISNPIIFIPILVISSLIAAGVIFALHCVESFINNNYDKHIDENDQETMKFADLISNARFYTRGKDPVAVGVKRVLDLLEKGVHPDQIILKGNSIGGGVSSRVYKIFADKGIHLRCQIDTSFSSTNNVVTSILRNIHHENNLTKYGAKFLLLIKGMLLRFFGWNIETYKTINSITPYTMSFNNEGDTVIGEEAQLVTKIREMEKNGKNKNNKTTEDKIFELLFKKHTTLKPNKVFCDEYEKEYEAGCYNTHNLPLSCLESAKSPDIGAEDLHYLFTYLPYHMDVLRTEVGNWPVEQRDADELVNDILEYIIIDNYLSSKKAGYFYGNLLDKHQFLNGCGISVISDLMPDEYKNYIRTKLKENKNIGELKDILISLAPQEKKLSLILQKVLLNSSVEEIEELKGLLDKLDKKESCLTQNQSYSQDKCKKGLDKLRRWVDGYGISFVDLDNPKAPNGSLITQTSPYVQLLSNKTSLA